MTTGYCAGHWRCELCGLVGQVWEGHEDTTSLANHMRICHKEASTHV